MPLHFARLHNSSICLVDVCRDGFCVLRALCRQPLRDVMHKDMVKHSSRAGGLQCFMHSCKYMMPLSLIQQVRKVHSPMNIRGGSEHVVIARDDSA